MQFSPISEITLGFAIFFFVCSFFVGRWERNDFLSSGGNSLVVLAKTQEDEERENEKRNSLRKDMNKDAKTKRRFFWGGVLMLTITAVAAIIPAIQEFLKD